MAIANALLVDVDDEAGEAELGGVGGGNDALAAQQALEVLEVPSERERAGQQVGGGLAQGVHAVLVRGQRVDHHHPDRPGSLQRAAPAGQQHLDLARQPALAVHDQDVAPVGGMFVHGRHAAPAAPPGESPGRRRRERDD